MELEMLFTKLNEKQLEAAKHRNGPLLVLAGAGSGKTRVVTYRIAHLIDTGVPPSKILAVTFTNKAAQEMQFRVHELLKGAPLFSLPTICTFHSLGVRILRASIQHLGFSPQFLIYDEEDANKLLKSCLQTLNVAKEANLTKSFHFWISHAKNQLLLPHDVPLSDLAPSTQNIFPEVYALYQQRLKESNAVDFDDLLYLPVRLFQEHPDILNHYQERWSYLLIDEYQDTNHAQYLLAKMLVQKSHQIFVVGDPDQSIYSWRGANIHNILNFEKDYPGTKTIRLEQNYRSRTNILEAANSLIKHNTSRFEKDLWSKRGPGSKIGLFLGDSEYDEATFVVNEIERMHLLHRIPFSEITIFYRTNFQSRLFEDYLLRKRIPYVIVGGISFYQRKEIKDLLAFLRLILSDQDTISFERTINLPKRGFGLVTIEKIRQKASEQNLPILEFCRRVIKDNIFDFKLTAAQKTGLSSYIECLDHLKQLKDSVPLHTLVSETVQKTCYLDVLKEDRETFDDRKENVGELISKAHEWEMLSQSRSLDEFLEELSLKSSLDEAQLAPDKINLMTIHNGKGLEFDIVFLVGMEEDLFPHVNSRNNQEGVEEERRLCYVGMTRAKEYLYLSAATTRFLWGGMRAMRPSRFLRELPREYLVKI